jgi:hypothetical protein
VSNELEKTWGFDTFYIRMRRPACHDEQESSMDATQDECVKYMKSIASEKRYASKLTKYLC